MWYGWPYTDLHSLNLDWILNQLKMWQAQWEQLPNYIKEQIEQFLSDANLAEIVQNVLQEYGFVINVKVPGNSLTPAKGDGSTDDTAAIQAMIAYGSTHGMPLLFPAGTYRISGLNVSVDTVFMGSASTLMLINSSSAPLISVSAKFECFGMTLNGNIGGQTTPQNVINCTSGRFMIDHCHISSGLSGIAGSVTGDCRLVNSEISNFSEYGMYLEGTGRIVSTGVDIPNVASGGALRFIRLDVSNSFIDAWESIAEVAVGVEITGDNNYVNVNFPNVETPVNDGGQNNNWNVVGKSRKEYVNGTVTRNYKNLSETVNGDYTQHVGDFDGTAEGTYSLSGEDVVLNPTNPLTYKSPTSGKFFEKITFKDNSGTVYNVLVEKDSSFWEHLIVASEEGIDNSGNTDCTQALSDLISSMDDNDILVFDYGTYLISGELSINKMVLFSGGTITASENLSFERQVMAPRYQIFNTIVSLSPQRICPEWFGCSSDGTDGTVGINNAISSISKGGIISFLPVYSGAGGHYLINGTVVLETSGIEIEGNGAAIQSNATTLFDCTPDAYTEEVKIHDLKIICTNSNNNSTCFNVNNCTRFWFNNIIMVGWFRGAVLSDTVNAIFNNVFYIMQVASDCVAFELGETNASARFIECYCAFDFGSANQGTGWLITGHDFRDLILDRCETAAGSNGINFGSHSSSDTVYAWDIFITNCVFDNFKGRAILANYMKTAINIQISNCWFTPGTSNGYCVELNSVDNIGLTGCEFMSVQTGGLCGIIANASSNLMISNNTFLNCNPAINISSGCIGIVLANNSIATTPDSPSAGEMNLTNAIMIAGDGILAIGNSIFNAGGTPSYSNGINIASGTTNSTAAFNFINSGTPVVNNAGSGCVVINRGQNAFS